MDLVEFGQELEVLILEADRQAGLDGRVLSDKSIEIRLVGQCSLLADEVLSSKIELDGTRDFDAFKKANIEIESLFFELLKVHGYVYDNLSSEIWMPSETKWIEAYRGDYVSIYRADPLYVLTSKAVKAAVRNKNLVIDALGVFGNELGDLIVKHGGDLDEFKK